MTHTYTHTNKSKWVSVQEDNYYGSKKPYIRSKEPYIRSKEPYIRSKEPYTRSKEPYLRSKEPFTRWKEPYIRSKEPYIRSKRPPLGLFTIYNTQFIIQFVMCVCVCVCVCRRLFTIHNLYRLLNCTSLLQKSPFFTMHTTIRNVCVCVWKTLYNS